MDNGTNVPKTGEVYDAFLALQSPGMNAHTPIKERLSTHQSVERALKVRVNCSFNSFNDDCPPRQRRGLRWPTRAGARY